MKLFMRTICKNIAPKYCLGYCKPVTPKTDIHTLVFLQRNDLN